MAAAATELRQAYVQAVSKPEARADIATIDGRLQQQKINLSYAESQLSRGAVTATRWPVTRIVTRAWRAASSLLMEVSLGWGARRP